MRKITRKRNQLIAGVLSAVIVVLIVTAATLKWQSQPLSLARDGYKIVAVGDIVQKGGKYEKTAKLVSELKPQTILLLGDTAYEKGTPEQFRDLYDPSWGVFKDISAPAPGNHEYKTPGASGYYEYFGESAGPDRRGYYSFDVGSWHIISLNSEVLNDAQLEWLEKDLTANVQPCILAYWHQPLFSSGAGQGNYLLIRPLWDRLYEHGADLVLNGHEHVYERFAKQNSDEKPDSHGIRQFTVGTGGASQYGFKKVVRPNSEVRAHDQYGVLMLWLKDDSYDAEFVPAAGSTFRDGVYGEKCN
jgi:acid phosphatase type 7